MWLGELTTHCLRGEAIVSNNDSEVILTVKLKEGVCASGTMLKVTYLHLAERLRISSFRSCRRLWMTASMH